MTRAQPPTNLLHSRRSNSRDGWGHMTAGVHHKGRSSLSPPEVDPRPHGGHWSILIEDVADIVGNASVPEPAMATITDPLEGEVESSLEGQ